MLQVLVFYAFAAVLLGSAVMVISARNSVHAVLFLILCFFNAAGLFLLMGAEFIAMILVIVYVGAVAVLFLFVVMMLDIDFNELRRGFLSYLPIGALVGLVILVELGMVLTTTALPAGSLQTEASAVDNTTAIGEVLYTQYAYPFQISGLVLLVAMIGAITLTLRHKTDVKRQQPMQQLDRTRDAVVQIRKVKPGEGAV